MKRIILDLCGGTGSWSKPYEDVGYKIYNITLPEYDVTNVTITDEFIAFHRSAIGSLVIRKNAIHGILAAPPCTEFSIAKNHKISRDLPAGLKIVNACMRIIDGCEPDFWAMENPSGILHKLIGPPKYTFQPYHHGDAWTKRTMVWGNFNIPKRQFEKYDQLRPIKGLYVRPGRKTASIAFNHKSHKKFIRAFDDFEVDTDAAFRAITPPGFARAFFDANK